MVPEILDCLRGAATFNFLVGGGEDAVFRHSRLCHGFAPFRFGESERDLDRLESLINCIDQTKGVDVILPCDTPSILAAIKLGSRIRQNLIPLPSLSDFTVHNDKWRFRALCEECGVPTPKTLYFSDKSQIDFTHIKEELGLPFVIKPTNEEAGRGIMKIATQEKFEHCLRDNPYYSFAPLIAQEFVHGQDIDLSLLVSHGGILCHAAQMVTGGVTHFVRADELLEMGKRVVAHTGFNGVVHFDARFDCREGIIKFIESNPRFWGSVAKAKTCGLNFVTAGIALALGEWPFEVQSIEGKQYQATPAFFLKLLTAQVPLTELQWATTVEMLSNLSDPVTLFLKKYTRIRERAKQRQYRDTVWQ
jgi:biotin carboxylase